MLGVLAEVHPSDMVNSSDKLYKAYLGELKEQVCLQIKGSWVCLDQRAVTSAVPPLPQMTSATREPKLLVVAGCLRGLSALMVNFPKTKEEGGALRPFKRGIKEKNGC